MKLELRIQWLRILELLIVKDFIKMNQLQAKAGFLVTFEGTEGSGKSTLSKALYAWMLEQKVPCLLTREPGGTPLAENLRSLLLNPPLGVNGAAPSMDPRTELLLYEAARSHHVAQVIAPAILDGKIVLCDRFTDSTYAYQGAGRKIETHVVSYLNDFASYGLVPKVTFLLKVEVQLGLLRAKDPNRFEKEDLDFHLKVDQGFEALAKKDPKRFVVLDAALNAKQWFMQAQEVLTHLINEG